MVLALGAALATVGGVAAVPPPSSSPVVTAVPTIDPCAAPANAVAQVVATCAAPTIVPTVMPTWDPCAVDQALPAMEPLPTCAPPCVRYTVDAAPVPTACETPFESFQGETAVATATPPPTATESSPASEGSMPPAIMLISLLFGGLGLMAVTQQRRTIRR